MTKQAKAKELAEKINALIDECKENDITLIDCNWNTIKEVMLEDDWLIID